MHVDDNKRNKMAKKAILMCEFLSLSWNYYGR